MSSKLVRKLLQQTTLPPTNNDLGNGRTTSTQQRKVESAKNTPQTFSKADALHEQAQSLLRLDGAVKEYSSNTAQRSFQRHNSNLRHQKRERNTLKRNLGGLSNSRSSSSSFANKPHERSFDKERDKRRKEEGYFEDLARALKKVKRGKK